METLKQIKSADAGKPKAASKKHKKQTNKPTGGQSILENPKVQEELEELFPKKTRQVEDKSKRVPKKKLQAQAKKGEIPKANIPEELMDVNF